MLTAKACFLELLSPPGVHVIRKLELGVSCGPIPCPPIRSVHLFSSALTAVQKLTPVFVLNCLCFYFDLKGRGDRKTDRQMCVR